MNHLDILCYQVNSFCQNGLYLVELLAKGEPYNPAYYQKLQAIHYSVQHDNKASLQKTLFTYVNKHREIDLVSNQDLHIIDQHSWCWKCTLHTTGGEMSSLQPSYKPHDLQQGSTYKVYWYDSDTNVIGIKNHFFDWI